MIKTFYYKSPIGILEIKTEKDFVIAQKLVEEIGINCRPNETINKIISELNEYFSGRRKSFDIKIKPKGTPFQQKVWSELQKIPYQETKSYSEISNIIGNINASRAVGNACNKNPILIFIPCHRVISKSGKLSGFAYGVNIKKSLLELENCQKFN